MNRDGDQKCPYCGSDKKVVWVHGHGQCASCGINIEECCSGEQCREPKGEHEYYSDVRQ